MEPAGQLSLPVELLNHIGKYLSKEDILNLSQTCHYLRDSFNSNSVWKRFISANIISLQTLDQIVKPPFHYNSILRPLCENREHYLRKLHLLNNWKNGNFIKRSTETKHFYSSTSLKGGKGRGSTIYNDKYIFLGRFTSDVKSDGIEVWDINESPFIYYFFPVKNTAYNSFYVIGSNLVVVECKRVLVYQISLPEKEFPLLYSFVFSQECLTSGKEAEHIGQCDYECSSWLHFNVGNYVISHKSGGEENVLHIWDIFNTTKFGSFIIPVEVLAVVSITPLDNNECLLTVQNKTEPDYSCLLFNVKNKTFSDSVFNYCGYALHTIFYKSHIILFKEEFQDHIQAQYNIRCRVYDFKTSKLIKMRCFIFNQENYYCINSTTVNIVNGTFIVLSSNCLQIVDALSLKTIDEFQCDFANSSFKWHQFSVFGSLVVKACILDFLYVYDIRNKKIVAKPLKVGYGSQLHLSESCTKVVTCNNNILNVLHFW